MSASSRAAFPRREFLKAGGALLIGFAISPKARAQQPELIPVDLVAGPGQPDPDRLDTWIAVHADNTATIYFGYVDMGQGITTAVLQIAAEELDLGLDQVKTVRLESSSGDVTLIVPRGAGFRVDASSRFMGRSPAVRPL